MIDIQKLFESLRNKSDHDARSELQVALNEPSEHATLRAARYRPVQATSNTGFGFATSVATNEVDLKDASLFYIAVVKNKLHCAVLLLQSLGMDILTKSTDLDENGFHAVARCDNNEFKAWFFTESCVATHMQLTKQYQNSINATTHNDQHVLTLTPMNRISIEEVQYWIKLGADPLLPGTRSGTFLHYLCEKNRPELVRLIAHQFKDIIYVRNEKGRMPIHIAASLENAECFKVLVEAGSPIAVEDKQLYRPLHLAIAKGALASVHLMLEQQPTIWISSKEIPYVNVPTATLETPLHILIGHSKLYTEARFKETLDLLISYGADVSLQNNKNQTPIRLARELLDDNKLTSTLFEYLWEKAVEKLPLHLFSQDTLIQKICAYYPPNQAQQLIAQLLPVFQAAGPSGEAMQLIYQRYGEALKQQAQRQYADNPQVLQPFSIILDEVAKAYQAILSERTHTHARLSFTHRALNPPQEGNVSGTALARHDSSALMNTG